MIEYERIYNKEFNFMDNKLTLSKIREWNRIKTYAESSHFDRILLKDSENDKLYLYEFYEYVDFNGGDDQIYTTYTLVNDETDADQLNEERDIRRTPFFRVQPDYGVIISE